jgi:hypothetical protein
MKAMVLTRYGSADALEIASMLAILWFAWKELGRTV